MLRWCKPGKAARPFRARALYRGQPRRAATRATTSGKAEVQCSRGVCVWSGVVGSAPWVERGPSRQCSGSVRRGRRSGVSVRDPPPGRRHPQCRTSGWLRGPMPDWAVCAGGDGDIEARSEEGFKGNLDNGVRGRECAHAPLSWGGTSCDHVSCERQLVWHTTVRHEAPANDRCVGNNHNYKVNTCIRAQSGMIAPTPSSRPRVSPQTQRQPQQQQPH